jgi:hypothetical protein
MKDLSVYKVSLNTPKDSDENIEQDIVVRDIYTKYFSEDDIMHLFQDEKDESCDIYFFIPESLENKVYNFFNEVKVFNKSWVVDVNNITKDILYHNKFIDKDELVVDYILENLTKDDVLDKINLIGFDNISKYDLEILSK